MENYCGLCWKLDLPRTLACLLLFLIALPWITQGAPPSWQKWWKSPGGGLTTQEGATEVSLLFSPGSHRRPSPFPGWRWCWQGPAREVSVDDLPPHPALSLTECWEMSLHTLRELEQLLVAFFWFLDPTRDVIFHLFIYFEHQKHFVLVYSQLTVLEQCFRWTAKGVKLTCTCIHSFPNPLPIQTGTSHWAEFPVLDSRSVWLFIVNKAVYAWPS